MRDVVAILALACGLAFAAWLVLAALTLVNRVLWDRHGRSRTPRAIVPGSRVERRLVRRARGHLTEAGRWRRIAALRALVRARHPVSPELLEHALRDSDAEVAGAAVRSLGELGDERSAATLVQALRDDLYPRSRIAAQLERLAPRIGHLLAPLLDDPRPPVRFWGATLLARYPGLAERELAALGADADPNVRAAAVETLGQTDDMAWLPTALALLDDPVWFVRLHACRAVGDLAVAPQTERVAPLLADDSWWVRAAAKDALRGWGTAVAAALMPYLDHTDGFARNGAAEVLQDVGFVDELGASDPHGELLARIYAAGGPRLREAAERRAGRERREEAA